MNNPLLRLASLLLAIAWAGVIFYLSSRQSLHAPDLFPGQDKLFHLISFGILGFFGMGAMKPVNKHTQVRQMWLVVILVGLYGILDEIHQHYVPGRTVDGFDVLADIIGGVLGAGVMYYIIRLLKVDGPVVTVITKDQKERV